MKRIVLTLIAVLSISPVSLAQENTNSSESTLSMWSLPLGYFVGVEKSQMMVKDEKDGSAWEISWGRHMSPFDLPLSLFYKANAGRAHWVKSETFKDDSSVYFLGGAGGVRFSAGLFLWGAYGGIEADYFTDLDTHLDTGFYWGFNIDFNLRNKFDIGASLEKIKYQSASSELTKIKAGIRFYY